MIVVFYCDSLQAMFVLFSSKWLVLVACLTSYVGVLGNEHDGVGSGIRGAGADAVTAGPKDGEVRIIRISRILPCCVKPLKLRTKLLGVVIIGILDHIFVLSALHYFRDTSHPFPFLNIFILWSACERPPRIFTRSCCLYEGKETYKPRVRVRVVKGAGMYEDKRRVYQ
jgi:hypothetical protein